MATRNNGGELVGIDQRMPYIFGVKVAMMASTPRINRNPITVTPRQRFLDTLCIWLPFFLHGNFSVGLIYLIISCLKTVAWVRNRSRYAKPFRQSQFTVPWLVQRVAIVRR